MKPTTRLALFLSLIVPFALSAQEPPSSPCNTAPQSCATTISTRATATRRMLNSAVDITVGLTASDKEIGSVQRQLAQQTGTLLAYLRRQKVERLITNSVNVSPEVHYEKNAANKIVGYNGSTSISFRTSPEKAPEILTGVLTNGANTIGATNFTPTEEDLRTARQELSAEAVRTAVSQANAIAKAAEMRVVAVKSINVDNQNSFSPRPTMYAGIVGAKLDSVPPIDTAAGEQEITVAVDVVVAARP